MLKVENVKITGFEPAIRGMRNPLNSWDKSDSFFDSNSKEEYLGVGLNDLDLMVRLRRAGSDHGKFMRMLIVYLDITAPLYWWKEFDTYKVGTVANSCSTMHKIHDKEFTMDDFSHEHLDRGLYHMLIQNDKNQHYFSCSFEDILYIQIEVLNRARKLYLETKDKKYWWQMIQLLPSSYNQKRTVMLNYEVLRNIYNARKNHKLDEWHTLCDWINTLPFKCLITEERND